MGILGSLFGGKKDGSKVKVTLQTSAAQTKEDPLKKVSSSIQESVLLSLAENYKVSEKKYPDYLRDRYGIGFPKEIFQKLEKKGFIRQSTAIEALPKLKAAELKTIASKLGIKTSGNKDVLCERIAETASEETLASSIPERYWVVTEKGKATLEENRYIGFYTEKHPYNLNDIGLDINSFSKLFAGNPNGSVRDIIWGELNRRSIDYYKQAMTKREFRDYCNLLRTMALFLEEESRHKDALAAYMRYIHYRANFDAAIIALHWYSFEKNINEAADTLFTYARILPFIANEIQEMSSECDLDSKQLYSFMTEMLTKEKDTGVFSPKELADFVMYGLNGDQDGQKKICRAVMKEAAKKIPKKR